MEQDKNVNPINVRKKRTDRGKQEMILYKDSSFNVAGILNSISAQDEGLLNM